MINQFIFSRPLQYHYASPPGGTANIRNGTQSEQQQWGSRKNRTILMHEAVAELLTWIDRTSSFVFADIDGQRLKDFFVTKQVKGYIRKSGVNPKLHFHSFRHTGATWMVQAGISIYTVSKILGHSSVSTTQIYAHWSPDQFHSAVNSIRLEDR